MKRGASWIVHGMLLVGKPGGRRNPTLAGSTEHLGADCHFWHCSMSDSGDFAPPPGNRISRLTQRRSAGRLTLLCCWRTALEIFQFLPCVIIIRVFFQRLFIALDG